MPKMTELMKLQARIGDESYAITEILFDETEGLVRYLAIKSKARGDKTEALVAIGQAETPDVEAGRWPLDLSAGALEDAPRWSPPDAEADGQGAAGGAGSSSSRVALPIEAWPPLIVGPFGNTTSPLMFYAQMRAATGEDDTPADGTGGGDGDGGAEAAGANAPAGSDRRHRHLELASVRIGGEVFGRDGALGTLADLLTDDAGRRITHLVVRVENATHEIPWNTLRHMADGGRHSVVSLGRDDLGPGADAS